MVDNSTIIEGTVKFRDGKKVSHLSKFLKFTFDKVLLINGNGFISKITMRYLTISLFKARFSATTTRKQAFA